MRRTSYAGRALGFGGGVPYEVVGLALVIAIAAGCDDDAIGGPADPPSGAMIPAATGCTNNRGADPGGGLEPRQLAAAYGIDKLWDAGFKGQGRRVALIEFDWRFDAGEFQRFSDCWGRFELPHRTVLGDTIETTPVGEPNFDAQTIVAVAPEVERIDMFQAGGNALERLPDLLAAALDPARTGGELVHVISISFAACEALWSESHPDALDAANAQLKRAAELGVKVFVSAGDAGSAGAYRDLETGKMRCVNWPVQPEPPPGVALAVWFPASSPWVTAVGGTELAIDGRIPISGSPEGGVATNEIVWNQEFRPGRFAAGGGQSEIFSVAAAPWQQRLGLDGMFNRPDVSALAGSPEFPPGDFGTSGSAPMTAGAMLVVDSYLVGHDVEPPGFLTPLLYELALNPADYERVFRDVVIGNNDVYHLGCCYAEPGYDTASGLGSIRFDELAAVLLERAGRR